MATSAPHCSVKPAGGTGGKTSRARAVKLGGKKRGGRTSGTRRGNGVGMGLANGAGWGGPAKGAGTGKKRSLLAGNPGPGRGKCSTAGEARKERTSQRTEALMEMLYEIATDPRAPTNARLAAANHLLDRILGKPAQMVLTSPQDEFAMLTDEELAAEVRAFRASLRARAE